MGDVIAADQKWHNMHNDDVVLRIDKVNKANSTFAGAYGMKRARDGAVVDWFPLRGEYDPQGITIGWVVSYWTGYFNWNSLDAWAGYLSLGLDQGSKWTISTTRISVQGENDTTIFPDTFVLEESDSKLVAN